MPIILTDGMLDCTRHTGGHQLAQPQPPPAATTTNHPSSAAAQVDGNFGEPARPHYCAPFLGHCDLDKAPSPRQLALLHCSCKAAAAACSKPRRYKSIHDSIPQSVGKLHYVVRSPWRTEACVLCSTWEWRFPLGPPGCPSWGTFGAREAQSSTTSRSSREHIDRSDMQVPSAVCSFSRPSWIDDDVSR